MPQYDSPFQGNDYAAAVQAYSSGLTDEQLYGFKDKSALQAHMESAGIWQYSGPFNSGNEHILNSLWDKRNQIAPIIEEKQRQANEASVNDATKKQQQLRAAQKTKQQSYEGRRGTFATGPMGLTDPADTSGRKTLLGM